MRLDELRRLRKLLDEATGPQDVFMALRDRSLHGPARERALDSELRALQSLANPERFMGNPPAQDLAREILAQLGEFFRLARGEDSPTEVGPVSIPASADATDRGDGLVVIVGANHYHLETRVTDGEIAVIHRGRCIAGPHAGVEVAA